MKNKDFEEWNEQMYRKHGNENRYEHPNFLIRYNSQKRVRLHRIFGQVTIKMDWHLHEFNRVVYKVDY